MTIRFRSFIAPVEKPTDDGRVFSADGGTGHRTPPFAWMAKFTSGNAHVGAVGVGVADKLTRGKEGESDGWWVEGRYHDPAIVPEVTRAVYLAKQGVLNPSVDLTGNYTMQVQPHATIPGKQQARFTSYGFASVTQVPIPAFGDTRIFCDNEGEKALLASVGFDLDDLDPDWMTSFAVNTESWKNFQLAPRDYTFDADNAVQRIAAWSGIGSKTPDVNKYASAFLWRDGNQTGDTLAQQSFRLPIIDIINGVPHLIYHAVYAAAALIQGAHGGLPNVPDADKHQIAGVINQIYAKMQTGFQDPQMTSPFQQPQQQQPQGVTAAMDAVSYDDDDAFVAFAGKASLKPYGDVEYADPGYQADHKKRYPVDSAAHCRAAWAYINQADNASQYSAEQLKSIKDRIKTAAKKWHVDIADEEGGEGAPDKETGMGEMSMSDELPVLLASVAPVAPPRAWFADPQLPGPTPLTIGDDGRVFGHLAEWRKCHLGIGDKCVMAPKTRSDYRYFKMGPVVCDDGTAVQVGKITLGTGHAHPQWGVVPSRNHYDNSGWAAAVVNVGEDAFGIWVSGALTSNMTQERIAELRRSPLSGDWRNVNGQFELIAALAVNNPGFPVLHVNDGRDFSLVAVGVVELSEPVEVPTFGIIDEPDDERLARLEEINRFAEEREQAKRLARFATITGQSVDAMPAQGGGDANSLAMQLDAFFTILENANNEADNSDPGHLPSAPPIAPPAAPGVAPAVAPAPAPAAPMAAPAPAQ